MNTQLLQWYMTTLTRKI